MTKTIETKVEERNKATMRQLTEAFNNFDRERFCACFADPCLYHFPPDGDDHSFGHAEHWEIIESQFKTFSDLKASIDSLIAEDDRAFVRWSYRGTHLGQGSQGIEPSGKMMEWGICWAEIRFEDGLAMEVWEICELQPV